MSEEIARYMDKYIVFTIDGIKYGIFRDEIPKDIKYSIEFAFYLYLYRVFDSKRYSDIFKSYQKWKLLNEDN